MAPELPLLDREHEAALIADAFADASQGRGRFLVIEGVAGIGKTRLLRHTRQLAADTATLLSARGSDLEREFAFGMVRQLFEPLVAAGALTGAAAGAARVFAPEAAASGAELPILHGLYWLTVSACRRTTVLLLDDLHWSDASSLRYLAYLLPRLDELALLVVAVVRTGEPAADEGLLHRLLADPAVAVLRPGPLGGSAAGTLLSSLLGRAVDGEFAAACTAATGGNPLLLQALADTLDREGVEPTAANQDRVGELGPTAVARHVALRIERLPEAARSLARSAAVLGQDAPLTAVAALAGTDRLTAVDLAEQLARQGLLEVQEERVNFVHPVVAAAVYGQLGGGERARAHGRAADILAGLGEGPERCAVHLLKTVPAGNGEVAPRLRRAATVALARGSPDAALAFLRRCLQEPLPPGQRLELLRQAAEVAVHVDLPEAVSLFEAAKALADDPASRAGLAASLGVAYGYLIAPDLACDALEEALRALPDGDSDERRRLEATLLVAVFVAPGRREIAGRLAELAALPQDDGLGARMLQSAIGAHEMAVCDPHGLTRVRAAVADGLLLRQANGEGALVCGWLTLLAADDPLALDSLDEAVRHAHLHGSLRALAPAYTFRALGCLWTGELVEAEHDAREALRLAEPGRVDMDVSFAGAYLADSLIEQGRLDEAADVLEQVGVPADSSASRPRYYALDAYARLLRRRGDRGAVEAAFAAGRAWQAYGFDNPALGAWRTEAALSLHAASDLDGALALAREELVLARRWSAPRALGRALRVVGQLTGGADGLAMLRESVDVLDGTRARLELAQSLAELGAALRRAGRRTDAREPLGQALDLAEVCAAAPLVQQVKTELNSAGFRPRRHRLAGPAALTPSERRVAELAATGSANRDIAQALFVTTKTVEVHLTNAYRKLGVRRRAELARTLDEQPP